MTLFHAIFQKTAIFLVAILIGFAADAQQFFVLASTTSTEQSGLFDYLLPIFTAKTGIQVHVVAQGTGQALDTGRRGDADALLVHNKEAELLFVQQGFGVDRREVMYNDFVLIGPKQDPAGIKNSEDVVQALQAIAKNQASFISRGDKSGTHSAELRLWKAAQLSPAADKPSWYREAGAGMGPTLNIASATHSYVLSDRATWLAFKNRGDLEILVAGDTRLFNQYSVILVNPEKHPHVKQVLAKQFMDWLVSSEGQTSIAQFHISGQPLFFPNAQK